MRHVDTLAAAITDDHVPLRHMVQLAKPGPAHVPLLQVSHTALLVDPSRNDAEPAVQFMQSELAGSPGDDDQVPAGQFRQLLVDEAPSNAEYVPGTHCRQTDTDEAPTTVEYCPAEHETHVAALAVDHDPAWHVSHEITLAPINGENVPAPQLTHVAVDDAPGSSE